MPCPTQLPERPRPHPSATPQKPKPHGIKHSSLLFSHATHQWFYWSRFWFSSISVCLQCVWTISVAFTYRAKQTEEGSADSSDLFLLPEFSLTLQIASLMLYFTHLCISSNKHSTSLHSFEAVHAHTHTLLPLDLTFCCVCVFVSRCITAALFARSSPLPVLASGSQFLGQLKCLHLTFLLLAGFRLLVCMRLSCGAMGTEGNLSAASEGPGVWSSLSERLLSLCVSQYPLSRCTCGLASLPRPAAPFPVLPWDPESRLQGRAWAGSSRASTAPGTSSHFISSVFNYYDV